MVLGNPGPVANFFETAIRAQLPSILKRWHKQASADKCHWELHDVAIADRAMGSDSLLDASKMGATDARLAVPWITSKRLHM